MATTKELERRGYKIVNAKLKSAGFHDLNGVVVVSCELEFEAGGGGFGSGGCGYYCPSKLEFRGTSYGMAAMLWIMAVAGVDQSEEVGGQYIRVAIEESKDYFVYIGHIMKDIWFNFQDLRKLNEEHKED